MRTPDKSPYNALDGKTREIDSIADNYYNDNWWVLSGGSFMAIISMSRE